MDRRLLLIRKAVEDNRLEAGVGVLGDGVQPRRLDESRGRGRRVGSDKDFPKLDSKLPAHAEISEKSASD